MTKSIDVLIDGWSIKNPDEILEAIPENISGGASYINRLIRVLELTKFMTPKQIESFEAGYDDQGIVIVSSLWQLSFPWGREGAFEKWWDHYHPLLQKEFNDDDDGSGKDENGDDWIVGKAHDIFEFIFTYGIDAIIIT